MKRTTLLSSLFALGIVPSVAFSSAAAPATYILQVSSNLKCDNLAVEVVSQTNNTSQHLNFNSDAFAAVELTAGAYEFGEVTCNADGRESSYNVLQGNLEPFTVDDDVSYFGGRIIFEEVIEKNVDSEPKVFSDCPRVRSSARGQSSDGCFDGSSDNLSRNPNKQLKVYAPEVSEQQFETINTAYSKATKQQLVFLPIKS